MSEDSESMATARPPGSRSPMGSGGGAPEQDSEPVTYPRARRPDRRRWVNDFGVNLAVSEWRGCEGAQTGLARRTGRSPATHVSTTLDGLAPLPRVGRGPGRPRRLAVEARPDAAVRRLRTVAAGMVDAANAVPEHAGPRNA